MSEIILPEGVNEEENDDKNTEEQEGPVYQATEDDEERFFLMYHMNLQPSEVESMNPLYRKWLIMRFIGQKNLEKEAMQRMELMRQVGPNLRG